jgi:hypothetical protein
MGSHDGSQLHFGVSNSFLQVVTAKYHVGYDAPNLVCKPYPFDVPRDSLIRGEEPQQPSEGSYSGKSESFTFSPKAS